MAGSTTTTLNDLLPSIVAEAMFVASERSIMRGLVKNYSLAPGQGKTVQYLSTHYKQPQLLLRVMK
jgi:hypothetical protein